jgi:hypothetical protein
MGVAGHPHFGQGGSYWFGRGRTTPMALGGGSANPKEQNGGGRTTPIWPGGGFGDSRPEPLVPSEP